jgi:hypothetical protein
MLIGQAIIYIQKIQHWNLETSVHLRIPYYRL